MSYENSWPVSNAKLEGAYTVIIVGRNRMNTTPTNPSTWGCLESRHAAILLSVSVDYREAPWLAARNGFTEAEKEEFLKTFDHFRDLKNLAVAVAGCSEIAAVGCSHL